MFLLEDLQWQIILVITLKSSLPDLQRRSQMSSKFSHPVLRDGIRHFVSLVKCMERCNKCQNVGDYSSDCTSQALWNPLTLWVTL